MCNFSIAYPKPKSGMVDQLRAAIDSQTNGLFKGDTSQGEFSFSAKGFNLAGNYKILGDIIEVCITKKPWLLSCKKIESEIRNYLEEGNKPDLPDESVPNEVITEPGELDESLDPVDREIGDGSEDLNDIGIDDDDLSVK